MTVGELRRALRRLDQGLPVALRAYESDDSPLSLTVALSGLQSVTCEGDEPTHGEAPGQDHVLLYGSAR